MKIYFERQPRPGRDKRRRWWLATVSREESKEHKPDRPHIGNGPE
jgi:hypothetical protein